MRGFAVSLVVHALALIAAWPSRSAPPPAPAVASLIVATAPTPLRETELIVELDSSSGGGGGSSPAPAPSARRGSRIDPDAWQQVTVRVEPGGWRGQGQGQGQGNGNGRGIGFGEGGGVGIAGDVPAPPPAPVKVSRARAAQLIFPTRNRDVEDEADLFVARITVDTDGDVVGVRMVKTRPGVRGEQAADAIWTFRYLPALDDDGVPIASTFEQPFQIR